MRAVKVSSVNNKVFWVAAKVTFHRSIRKTKVLELADSSAEYAQHVEGLGFSPYQQSKRLKSQGSRYPASKNKTKQKI